MFAGVSFFSSVVVAASLLQTQSTNFVLLGAILVGGIFAWRQKRGDFYKAVAEEKTDENEKLKLERDRLCAMTDITPIVESLHAVTAALERSGELSNQVVTKVGEMNGSLRAHGEAMKALADHLILDAAAQGLLAAAADKPRPSTRRSPT
jgi:hypothetical protein